MIVKLLNAFLLLLRLCGNTLTQKLQSHDVYCDGLRSPKNSCDAQIEQKCSVLPGVFSHV